MTSIREVDRIDQIRDRLAVATPGPLQIEAHSHPQAGCRCLSCEVLTGCRLDHPTWVCCDETPEMQEEVRRAKAAGKRQEDCPYAAIPYSDAEFLSHAQEDVTYLLGHLAEVTADRDRARDVAVALEQELAEVQSVLGDYLRGLHHCPGDKCPCVAAEVKG